jgi:peptidoglycan-N-acetylglucosamine deacetylase
MQAAVAISVLALTAMPTARAAAPSATSISGPADAGQAPATRGVATQVGPTLAVPRDPVYFYRGRTDRKRVTLTFDAGADRGNAAGILDLLKLKGVKATFGITGHWADENPDLTKRMADEGHTFINHTYHHPSLTGFATKKPPLTAAEIKAELDTTEAALQRIAGATTKPWFRPPYMDMNAAAIRVVADAGYPLIAMHTVDSLGWQGLATDALVERCLSKAVPGAIYIFHVGIQSTDYSGLGRIIDGLRAAGYELTTMPDVL